MELLEKAQAYCAKHIPRVVFPDADDPALLKAIRILSDEKQALPILLGSPMSIRDRATAAGVHTRKIKIFHPLHNRDFDTYTKMYMKMRRHRGMTRYEAEDTMRQPVFHAAMMVREGAADLCMAGNDSPVADVLKAGLRILDKAERFKTIFGWTLLIAPDGENILAFADTAVIPDPTAAELAEIAVHTAEMFAELTGQESRVALLSFSTKGSASHQLAEKVQNAYAFLRKHRSDLRVEGEIQFDAAFVPEIGQKKAPGNVLSGSANVYIFPTLNAANIGYKIARHIAGYRTFGPFFQGFSQGFHGLQRGAVVQDIVDNTMISAYLTGNKKQ